MEEIKTLLLDKLNKAYQEESALFQHDHEVKAIYQFIVCPSNLNKSNLMSIIGIPSMQGNQAVQ